MSFRDDKYPDSACCGPALLALRAVGEIAEEEAATCVKCSFPFCIMDEARRVSDLSRAYVTRGMLNLGLTARAIADKLGINRRTIYRYKIPISNCHWCNIDQSPSNVFYRTRASTLAYDEDKVVVVLSNHRHATEREYATINYLTESTFPQGVLRNGNGNVHDHWEVTNVGKPEAQKVYRNMDFLSQFTDKLRR